jgi:hypothetical protein
LGVNAVIVLVRADKPDVEDPERVVDPDDELVPVAVDVEGDPSILEDACAAEMRLDFARIAPVGGFDFLDPGSE